MISLSFFLDCLLPMIGLWRHLKIVFYCCSLSLIFIVILSQTLCFTMKAAEAILCIMYIIFSYYQQVTDAMDNRTWQSINCESNQPCRCINDTAPCNINCDSPCEQNSLYAINGQDMMVNCRSCSGIHTYFQNAMDVTIN